MQTQSYIVKCPIICDSIYSQGRICLLKLVATIIQAQIIGKIYKNIFFQKIEEGFNLTSGGETGIEPWRRSPATHTPGVRLRPLGHLSFKDILLLKK